MMEAIRNVLVEAFTLVLRASWHASLLVVLILAVRALLPPARAARIRYLLWMVLLGRLLLPDVPSSRFSPLSLVCPEPSGTSRTERPSPDARPGPAPIAAEVPRTAVVPPLRVPDPGPLIPSEPGQELLDHPHSEAIAATGRGIDIDGLLATVWLAGVFVLAGRFTADHIRIHAALLRMPVVVSGPIAALLEECRHELGIRRRVRVVSAESACPPGLTGILRPTIVLPAYVQEGLDLRQLRHVLLHELAHIRLHDVAVSRLAAILRAVHWYNPLVWLAARLMREDCEIACDATVLAGARPPSAGDYGRTAIRVMEIISSARRELRSGAGLRLEMGSDPNFRRISMIARFRRPTIATFAVGLAAASVLAWSGLTGPARAMPEEAAASVADAVDRYGDPLPPGAAARMGTIRLRHPSDLKAVAVSPDGKTVAAAGGDVRLWDAATGKLLASWSRPDVRAGGVGFSPDGRRLVLVTAAVVSVRDVASGREEWSAVVRLADRVAFAPDGRSILVWGGTWSTLGNEVVSCEGRLVLLDAATGKEIREFRGHEGSVTAAGFASGGNTVASASRDNTVRIWDAATGAETRRFAMIDGATLDGGKWLRSYRLPMAVSPDGRRIAWSVDGVEIELRDLAAGEVRRALRGHTGNVAALAFSPDSLHLASGAEDHSIRLWDVASGSSLRELRGHESWVECLAFSADGRTLASGAGDRVVGIWDAGSGEPRLRFPAHRMRFGGAALSPDGAALATAGIDGIRIWRPDTGEEIAEIRGKLNPTSIAWSPDGRWLAAGSHDGPVHAWRMAGARPADGEVQFGGRAMSVAFSPDVRALATGGYDKSKEKEVVLWSFPEGKLLRSLGPGIASGLTFSADGQVLAGRLDKDRVRIWQLFPGGWARTIGSDLALKRGFQAIALSPDGKELLTAGESETVVVADGKIQPTCRKEIKAVWIWSVETGEIIRGLPRDPVALAPVGEKRPHCLGITAVGVAVSPDGSRIAVTDRSGRISLHDHATGRLLGEWATESGVATHPLFSRDGRRLFTVSEEQLSAMAWDLTRIGR
jgi:WD40 repeat protein/beta-lactamase regulating signal transducer with metallopeptidase domain